jgi:hypothetical protein
LEERERQQQREIEAKEREREAQAKEKEAMQRHELEMKQLEVKQALNADGGVMSLTQDSPQRSSRSCLSLLPDGKDNLDSYLQRFERFPKSNKWNESSWATSVSAC